MKERWLYCEGQTDAPVLRAVFTAFGFDIITESTGGNPSEIARWRRENGVIAASISDRDYRDKGDCIASYNAGSAKFLWQRHSIENYLLEPRVVNQAISSIKRSLQALPHPPACTEGLPAGNIDAIRDNLVEAGKRIMHKECGCFCIQSLWVDLRESLGRIQQRIPAVFTSKEPVTQDECLTALNVEVTRLLTAISTASNAAELTSGEIAQRYSNQIMKLQHPSYWLELKFLHEFHGRRLLREFLKNINGVYGLQASPTLFTSELTNAIEAIARTSADAEFLTDFRSLGESVLGL